MLKFELLDVESRFFQQPAPGLHFKQPPDVGVSVDFKVIFITDEVDEGHLEMIVIGIRVVAVLDKSDLRVTSGMSGGDDPVLFETLTTFLDVSEENTSRIEMCVCCLE